MNDLIHKGYNESFIKAIRSKMFVAQSNGKIVLTNELLNKINEYSEDEFRCDFGEKDKTWLIKELSRWKNKLFKDEYNFQGTINNLEIFCSLTENDPNEVLLPNSDSNLKPGKELIFLSEDAVKCIVNTIYANNDLLDEELILPVKFAPIEMVFLFFKIYRDKRNDVMIVAIFNYFSSEDRKFHTDPFPFRKLNVSSPKKNDGYTFDNFFSEARTEFDDIRRNNYYKEYIHFYSKNNSLNQILIHKFENDMFFELYYPSLEKPQKVASSTINTLDNMPTKVNNHEER